LLTGTSVGIRWVISRDETSGLVSLQLFREHACNTVADGAGKDSLFGVLVPDGIAEAQFKGCFRALGHIR
jgi:hypothetical protein